MTKPLLENITDAEISDAQDLHVRYMIQLVLYQIMIVFQFIIIIASAIKFYYNPTSKIDSKSTLQTVRIKKNMKTLFILVMVLGTFIFLLVEWYGIADFLYDYAAYTDYCDVAAKLGNLSIMTYLLALYLFFLYRLHVTFKGGPFELSKRFLTILLTITFVVYFALVIAVFAIQKGKTEQVWFSWSGKVEEYKWITICAGEFSIGIDRTLRIILQVIVIIANIFYGWLFYKKLYDLIKLMELGINPDKNGDVELSDSFLRQNHYDLDTLNKLLKLVNRQTTLVMVSTVSTTLMWTAANVAHLLDSYLQVLIYLDISTNCLCLWLMFSWNHRLYEILCKPCAFMNNLLCSKFTGSTRIRDLAQSINLSKMDGESKTGNEATIDDKIQIDDHGSGAAEKTTPQSSQSKKPSTSDHEKNKSVSDNTPNHSQKPTLSVSDIP